MGMPFVGGTYSASFVPRNSGKFKMYRPNPNDGESEYM